MWWTALGVLDRDDDRRRPGVDTQLQRGGARVGEQPLLELRIDPGARDQPGAVAGRARHQPVDPPAHVLGADHALVDEQLLERPRPGRGGGLARRRVIVA